MIEGGTMVAQHDRTLSPRRVRAQFGVSRERMARLLDVSAKTIERWEERDALPANLGTRARLAKLQEIAELGLTVYTTEGFAQFLTVPHAALGGRIPLQLIEQGQAEEVLADL